MKFIVNVLIFITTQVTLFSQNEVIQDMSGDIFYVYDTGEGRDSIKMIGTDSEELLTYKTDGDELLFISKNRMGIGWMRYRVNISDQTCMPIYMNSISNYDVEMRGDLFFEIDDLNTIFIYDKKGKEELVIVKYKPHEGIYTINKKYRVSQEVYPIKYFPRTIINENGKVVRKN